MSREKGRIVKPEIPGSGGSVCCTTEPVLAMLVDLRAEVKRLKAAHAAKDAALVRTGKWVRLPDGNLMCQVCCTGMRCGCPSGGHIPREDCPNCLGKSGAALSPSTDAEQVALRTQLEEAQAHIERLRLQKEIERLEAACAEMRAALRSFALSLAAAEQLEDELDEGHGAYMVSLAFARKKAHKMCAALSSAGEGWMPPDKVKRLLEYCKHHSSCILEHHAPGVRDCGCGYVGVLRAALDALEKE
ncbi:hypothetical protein LCGC14_1952110 [marine sediment metagenome]|uniref:Uncharacterized protein n=1 Tax=marine sediment metagenome TaxID=412755 RepID=A0A0F9FHE0_9ZZZZ